MGLRFSSSLLFLWALASCGLCAAQAGSQSRVTSAQGDTYCFGCPAEGSIGPHPRSTAELIELASNHGSLLRQAIEETYPEKALELGRVWSGHLHDFFFAVRASARPTIVVDDQPGPEMQSVEATDLSYPMADAAHGQLSAKQTLVSQIYGGVKRLLDLRSGRLRCKDSRGRDGFS